MSVLFHARCECGYKSRRLMANTCVCRNCREIVDIPRMPFRYRLVPCPLCSAAVPEKDMLLNLLGKGYLVTGRPSQMLCPKCDNSNLTFHMDATVSLLHGTDFPSVGDEIEGRMKKGGKLDIPWFPLDAADVCHDIPASVAVGNRVRLRVNEIATSRPTDSVKSMFYRYVVVKLDVCFVGEIPESYD